MRGSHVPTSSSWTRRRSSSDAAPATEEAVSSGVLLGIVTARGAIDADTVAPFGHDLARSLGAGATRLLVDLSRTDDVSAACMNALLAARQRLLACGGRIAVVLSPRMCRRFEALGLARRFLIAEDRFEGVRLLGLGDGGSPHTSAPRPHAHAA